MNLHRYLKRCKSFHSNPFLCGVDTGKMLEQDTLVREVEWFQNGMTMKVKGDDVDFRGLGCVT